MGSRGRISRHDPEASADTTKTAPNTDQMPSHRTRKIALTADAMFPAWFDAWLTAIVRCMHSCPTSATASAPRAGMKSDWLTPLAKRNASVTA
jgi:hypothetical protein